MNLISVRIITANIKELVSFYEEITAATMLKLNEDFAELNTRFGTLAIGSTRTLQFFGGDTVAQAAQNRTAIIEFIVEDVDREYERLANFLAPYLVQKPTTMPWGNRSLLFRDPDDNLINFFTPVSAEAIQKFDKPV